MKSHFATLVMFSVGLLVNCAPEKNGSRNLDKSSDQIATTSSESDPSTSDVELYSVEAYALSEVFESLEAEDELVLIEVEDDDIDDEVSESMNDFLSKHDVDGDGELNHEERKKLRHEKREKMISGFDSDKDFKLSRSEKNKMLRSMKNKVKSRKSGFKGKRDFDKLCEKVEHKAIDLEKNSKRERPMFQRLMSKCMGLNTDADEVSENYGERKHLRCEKLGHHFPEGGQMQPPPGAKLGAHPHMLKRLRDRCGKCGEQDAEFDVGAVAISEMIFEIESEDSDLVAQFKDGDIEDNFKFRKNRFMNHHDGNRDGKIDKKERGCKFWSQRHKYKRLKKFKGEGRDRFSDEDHGKAFGHLRDVVGTRRDHHKGPGMGPDQGPGHGDFDKMCEKLKDRAEVSEGERVPPMMHRLMARCEGIDEEEEDNLDYRSKMESRCDRAKSKLAQVESEGHDDRKRHVLKKILRSCEDL